MQRGVEAADTDDEYEDEMEEDDDAAASGEAADDELNLKMFGIHQALPVAGEPDWDQEEVEDAFEYLRRVQHERAQVPAVVRVELPMSKLEPAAEGQWTSRPSNAARAVPAAGGGATAGAATSASAHRCASSWAAARQKEDDTQPPDWALPTATWLQEFTQQFQALRQQLQQQQEQPGSFERVRAPSAGEQDAWTRLCHRAAAEQAAAGARQEQPAAAEGEAAASADDWAASQDMFQTVMSMDQVAVADVLQSQVDALLAKTPAAIAPGRAQLLYSLAARLEKPLLPDVSACLRALLRHCVEARRQLGNERDPMLPHLNVLLAVTGGYFGQDELLCKQLGVDFHELL